MAFAFWSTFNDQHLVFMLDMSDPDVIALKVESKTEYAQADPDENGELQVTYAESYENRADFRAEKDEEGIRLDMTVSGGDLIQNLPVPVRLHLDFPYGGEVISLAISAGENPDVPAFLEMNMTMEPIPAPELPGLEGKNRLTLDTSDAALAPLREELRSVTIPRLQDIILNRLPKDASSLKMQLYAVVTALAQLMQTQETQVQETNEGGTSMLIEETAEKLRELGFTITDEMVENMKRSVTENPPRRPVEAADVATALLIELGAGDYDYDQCVWTPTSSETYWFDAEVFNIDGMYTEFLQGVAAIVPGFAPEDVTETLEESPQERKLEDLLAAAMNSLTPPSEGTKTVSFRLNGKEYQKELDFYGDWFNQAAFDWINEVLLDSGFDGKIWPFSDGGQGVILIYGSEERAKALEKLIPRSY